MNLICYFVCLFFVCLVVWYSGASWRPKEVHGPSKPHTDQRALSARWSVCGFLGPWDSFGLQDAPEYHANKQTNKEQTNKELKQVLLKLFAQSFKRIFTIIEAIFDCSMALIR